MTDEVKIVRRLGMDPVRDKMNKCKHYRGMCGPGMVTIETCGAGVKYADVRVERPFKYRHEGQERSKSPAYTSGAQYPCFRDEALIVGCPDCPKAEFPTKEEAEAVVAERRKHFEMIGTARGAIVAHLGGPWRKGDDGASGAIDCPACNGKNTLGFTRSSYNGHIHAHCRTKDCLSWME